MSQTLFITGANRGIGLEFTRQYLQAGWRVVATCRQPGQAESLQELQAQYPKSLRLKALNVTDWAAVARLTERLQDENIDLLINNAGVYGDRNQSLGYTDVADWLDVLAANTIAPLKIVEAVLPRLTASAPIITLTSLMGSVADNSSGGNYVYRSSKAGLNAVIKSLSIDLAGQHICVLFHPGWVQTDMGGPGAMISVETSVSGMRAVIEKLTEVHSGSFFRYDGKELPW